MSRIKKHISLFLLLVFAWVLTPAFFIHEAFADHEDTDCKFDKNSGPKLESVHTHCDIFTTNSPIYDSPKICRLEKPIPVLNAEYNAAIEASYFHFALFSLPSRAPPRA